MSQLTDLIRKKYPGAYDDMPDDELEKSILSKHPEYKDLASQPSSASPNPEDVGRTTGPQQTISEPPQSWSDWAKSGIRGVKSKFDDYLGAHLDELAQKKPGVLNPDPNQNPLLGKSVLPKTEQSPGILGAARHWGYENLVRPMASPLGALGTVLDANPPTEPIGVPSERISMAGREPPINLGKVSNDIQLPPQQPKGLPPAPPEITNKPSFLAGEHGVVPTNKNVPVDIGPVNPFPGQQGSGTILPRETEGVSQYPPDLAARYGDKLGRPYISPPQDAVSDFQRGGPVNLAGPPKPDFNIGNVGPVEQPSAQPKPIRTQPQTEPTQPTPSEPSPAPTPVNKQPIDTQYRPIDPNATPRDAVSQWADGRTGAKLRGQIAADKFDDLKDPSLIDKYEAGDRSGRLKDVQSYFDTRQQQAEKMGILKEDQKVLNYLAHYYEQSPEDAEAALKTYIAKNPSFAKERQFTTYSQAEAAGLKRKFDTIPDIVGEYETRFMQAVRNKELYDHLISTGQMSPTKLINTNPSDWSFKGPNADELKTLVGNYLGQSPKGLNKVANFVGGTKNLVLGSGIPGTPVNMHYWNTLRSKYYAQGLSGIGDYLSGTFNPSKDVNYLKSKQGLIADLVEHGMGMEDIEDHNALSKGSDGAKGFFDSVRGWNSKVFQDPLFKVRLPAAKVELAERVFNDNVNKLGRDNALKLAAQVSNDFMGGLNKTLRNKTYKDMSRIGLLAPDWLESRYNLAKRGIQSTYGGADPIYGKAMLRKAAFGAGSLGLTKAISGQFINPSNRSSNITSIPAGSAGEKNREVPIYGTTAEEFRLPAQIAAAAGSDESVGQKISDLTTSRISPPAKSALNIGLNRDDFGNPLYGKDKYGRPISRTQGALNTAGQVVNPITPPWLKMFYELAMSNNPVEQSLAQGVQAPVNYNTEQGGGRIAFRMQP